MKKFFAKKIILLCFMLVTPIVYADLTIPMYMTAEKGNGVFIGDIIAKETKKGVVFIPHLKNLSPGVHGFHVHQFANCSNMGMAAGEHFDPRKTEHHLGPYRQGHLGDLPRLTVDKNGTATKPVIAPRLKLSQIRNHSLMIHAGGDNYSDMPKAGGGGARIACGVIP
jgi:Cu-Zn family superoxide dismutase